MAIQAKLGARRHRLPAIVGLNSRAPHEHVCPLREGVGQQEFIVSRFVSAERQPSAIIPFDEDGWTAKRTWKTAATAPVASANGLAEHGASVRLGDGYLAD